MSLSRQEREALAGIETSLCEQDPDLARRLTTFTRPHRCRRWFWGVLAVLLVLTPLTLLAGIALHNVLVNALWAVLLAALLATAALLSRGAFRQ